MAASLPQVLRAPFESTQALASAAIPQVMRDCPWPPAAAMAWSPQTLARSIPRISPVRTQPLERAIFWNPASTHALEWNARHYVNTTRSATADELDGAEAPMSPDDFFRPPHGSVHYARIEVPREGGGAVHGAYREVRRARGAPRHPHRRARRRRLPPPAPPRLTPPRAVRRSWGGRSLSRASPPSHRHRNRRCGWAPPAR
jgi:hypothetical protein